MAHQSQKDFISILSKNMNIFFHNCKVLEIGSLNINGTVRDFFTDCEYIGIDIAEGKHVDVVCEGQNYLAPDNSFDQVISCEVMEHNPYWVDTFKNMIRVCKPGGLVVMTCASTGRAEHGTSRTRAMDSPLTTALGWEYYLNLTERNFKKEIDFKEVFSKFQFWINWQSYDLYFMGIKKIPEPLLNIQLQWDYAKQDVDKYLATVNKLKICQYRAYCARIFGDKWFIKMRDFEQILAYANGR